MNQNEEEAYWTKRYQEGTTGWDIGYPSTPIKSYIDQLNVGKDIAILIPGAGNAYEAEYIHSQGYTNVHVLDISLAPLTALQDRVADFPSEHLHHEDFFFHEKKYDLIIEQTFFCSFLPTPENRMRYAKKMSELLNPNGLLIGLWFDIPLLEDSKRPFGGSRAEYLSYFKPFFEVHTFENCYNSIPPRAGNELFGILEKL